MQPYTERPNDFTANIDISKPDEIVDMLKQCDLEMFAPKLSDQMVQSFQKGVQELVGDFKVVPTRKKTLYSDAIVKSIVEVAKSVKVLLQQNKSCDPLVILSGSGTSGRLAFMIARTYNRLCKGDGKKLAYTISGGDKALFTSQEAPEDDWKAGQDDLLKASSGKTKVLYIGISCGLSSPYVAGQLNYCMDNLDVFTPVLLGFNPVCLARNNPIQAWDKTFLKVARRLESLSMEGKAYLINPVLGGEAITGSSRMKGGSVTKVILETIFLLALTSSTTFTSSDCKSVLSSYESTCKCFYQSASSIISSLIESAGDSLKSDDHLYYVGSDGAGVLGIIDATECPPTYGSSVHDVRGFMRGGYCQYDNNEGDIGYYVSKKVFCGDENMIFYCPDLRGENYQIDTDDLATLLSSRDPFSSERNTIIALVKGSDDSILEELQETTKLGAYLKTISSNDAAKTRVAVVHILEENSSTSVMPDYLSDVFTIRIQSFDAISGVCDSFLTPIGLERHKESLLECCTKWLCNGISTGAHVLKGKVLKNYMVDVKVSNQKLFLRSIGIIQRFCAGLSNSEAQDFLLRSIYEVDQVDTIMLESTISSHIVVSAPKSKVVPIAIVMRNKRCSFEEAQNVFNEFHVVREAMKHVTKS